MLVDDGLEPNQEVKIYLIGQILNGMLSNSAYVGASPSDMAEDAINLATLTLTRIDEMLK